MSNDAGALDLGGVDIGWFESSLTDGGDVKSENLHVGVVYGSIRSLMLRLWSTTLA